jgi:hypothetical protein
VTISPITDLTFRYNGGSWKMLSNEEDSVFSELKQYCYRIYPNGPDNIRHNECLKFKQDFSDFGCVILTLNTYSFVCTDKRELLEILSLMSIEEI